MNITKKNTYIPNQNTNPGKVPVDLLCFTRFITAEPADNTSSRRPRIQEIKESLSALSHI